MEVAEITKRGVDTLLIRHLPNDLTVSEKIDLLKCFGAVDIRCMSERGRMKHTAFATFSDHKTATKALSQLHQLKILGHSLVVEFAKTEHERAYTPVNDDEEEGKTTPVQGKTTPVQGEATPVQGETTPKLGLRSSSTTPGSAITPSRRQSVWMGAAKFASLAENFGIDFPLDPTLKYCYPKPSVGILTNIVNVMVAVPKFYTQVLHLMNKMNLPAPFGVSLPQPPLPEDEITWRPPEPDDKTQLEMEMSSEEESELESDEDESKRKKKVFPVKRKSSEKPGVRRKKPKLQQLLAAGLLSQPQQGTPTLPAPSASHAFEGVGMGFVKKPEIRLADSIATALDRQQKQEDQTEKDLSIPGETIVTPESSGGFGTFAPPSTEDKEVEGKEKDGSSESEGEENNDYIKKEELKNRISKDEMKRMPVFKRYNPGEPNTRLYIKNLAKQVEEKDLKYIYGRYVDWSSEMDRDMFSIQLMKQGRMKGQAFIGLPSDYAAKRAVRETNGYLLFGKPVVVQFARSAKPKEKPEEKKK